MDSDSCLVDSFCCHDSTLRLNYARFWFTRFINRFKSASAKKVSARRVGKIYGNYVCSGESTISGAVKTQNDSEVSVYES